MSEKDNADAQGKPDRDAGPAESDDRKESDTATKQKPRRAARAKAKNKPRKLPPYHVVLLDDDDHSYEYVIEMLKCLFGYPEEHGYQIATEVDAGGRAVVATTHKELAELKRDQIRGYGVDIRVATCRGSMTAIIEPAERGD